MRSSVDENNHADQSVTIEEGWVARTPRSPALLQLENEEESRFLNEHEIVGLLGEGAYGKVYLVESKLNGKQYAIKVIEIGRYTTKNEALEEAKIHHQLKHTNIVLYQDSWIEPQTEVTDLHGPSEKMFCIQMECFKSTTLSHRMSMGMEPGCFWIIVKQVAQVLDYLHGKGIAHCDLHAGNILIDNRGRIKIIDFGQAKRLESFPEEFRATVMMQDIASLGIMAFDLLCGSFESSSDRQKALQDIQRRSTTPEEGIIKSLINQDYTNLPEPQGNKIELEDILSESTNFFKDKRTTLTTDDVSTLGLIALGCLGLVWTEVKDRIFRLVICLLVILSAFAEFFTSMVRTFNHETIKRRTEFEAAYPKIYKLVSRVTTLSV